MSTCQDRVWSFYREHLGHYQKLKWCPLTPLPYHQASLNIIALSPRCGSLAQDATHRLSLLGLLWERTVANAGQMCQLRKLMELSNYPAQTATRLHNVVLANLRSPMYSEEWRTALRRLNVPTEKLLASLVLPHTLSSPELSFAFHLLHVPEKTIEKRSRWPLLPSLADGTACPHSSWNTGGLTALSIQIVHDISQNGRNLYPLLCTWLKRSIANDVNKKTVEECLVKMQTLILQGQFTYDRGLKPLSNAPRLTFALFQRYKMLYRKSPLLAITTTGLTIALYGDKFI